MRLRSPICTPKNRYGTIYFQANPEDPEYALIDYSISGADALLSSVTEKGLSYSRFGPDYEAPRDVDGDNVYHHSLTASDGTYSTSQAVSFTVTDTSEAPSFPSGESAVFVENSIAIAYQAAATDPEKVLLTWSLSGTDAACFTIDSGGAVRFAAAPHYEAPQDQDWDNTYDISIIASDGTLKIARALRSKSSTASISAERRVPGSSQT